MLARASRYEFLPGVSLPTCNSEDLIVLKASADRRQDLGLMWKALSSAREASWIGIISSRG